MQNLFSTGLCVEPARGWNCHTNERAVIHFTVAL
jgi:hypothetical protein